MKERESMSDDTYTKLSAHFDTVHDLKGKPYITGEQVVSRLNEVLGWDAWNFEVVMHGYNEEADELWALGKLEVRSDVAVVVRQQFGSQQHNRFKDGGKIIDYGFDLKGAATDALKKCASLIGVGLYLLEKDAGQTARPPAQARPQQATKPVTPAKQTFMDYATKELHYEADTVLRVAKELYDSNNPNALGTDQKKRVLLAIEEGKKKEQAVA